MDEGKTIDFRAAPDLGKIYLQERDHLFRTLLAYTGGRVDIAEEAGAEAFARALAHEKTLRDPVAWIYRVAFNAANDELRRERWLAPASDRTVVAHEPEGLMDALKQLSPNQRGALVLRFVLDLDVAEVAKRMGMAPPTVRVHLHRGRRRLRELLGSDDED